MVAFFVAESLVAPSDVPCRSFIVSLRLLVAFHLAQTACLGYVHYMLCSDFVDIYTMVKQKLTDVDSLASTWPSVMIQHALHAVQSTSCAHQ